MRPHEKLYLREVVSALLLFSLASIAVRLLLPTVTGGWQHASLALLPLPPLVWIVVAQVRRLLAKDELEQRIELIAIAVSSASVGLGCFAWSQLANAHLLPLSTHPHVVVPSDATGLVLPWMVGVYGVVKLYLRWRYR